MSRNQWSRSAGGAAAVLVAGMLGACTADAPPQIALAGESVVAAVPAVETVAVAETVATAAMKPSITGVKYGDAFATWRRGGYEEAADLFRVYAEENPTDVQGHYMLGLAAWKSGDHTTAERALSMAVEMDGHSVKALTNLSRVLLEQARPREALPHMELATDLAPESPEVWRVYGNVLSELRRNEEALAAYRTALVRSATDSWSMNNYALVLIRLGRYDEALPPLARAVELAPESTLFRRNLDAVLARTGHDEVDVRGAALIFVEELNLWQAEMEHSC